MVQSLFDLETAIEIRHVHKGFIKLPISLVLERRAIKFLDLNFLYISKVLAFLDYLKKSKKAGDLLDKENISVQKHFNTAHKTKKVL